MCTNNVSLTVKDKMWSYLWCFFLCRLSKCLEAATSLQSSQWYGPARHRPTWYTMRARLRYTSEHTPHTNLRWSCRLFKSVSKSTSWNHSETLIYFIFGIHLHSLNLPLTYGLVNVWCAYPMCNLDKAEMISLLHVHTMYTCKGFMHQSIRSVSFYLFRIRMFWHLWVTYI